MMVELSPDELNIALAEKLFGWTVFREEHNGYALDEGEIAYGFPPDKSVYDVPYEIEDYLDYRGMGKVIEAMAKRGLGYEVRSYNHKDGTHVAYFHDNGCGSYSRRVGNTPSRAVALAALEALAQEVG